MLISGKRNDIVLDKTAGLLNIALCEFDPEWENVPANLSRLDAVMDEVFNGSVRDGMPAPDIVVLPECFSTGFSMNPRIAEIPGHSRTVGWMQRAAGLYDCAIAGSVPVWGRDARRYNRLFFVTPGGISGGYSKRHLFFGGETEAFTPGNSRTTVEYKGWRIMLGICFDLRFPAWCRNDMDNPYDLYINVANWPAARKRAAQSLIEARAIENAAYVAFCNRAGADALQNYAGGSAVMDFRGRPRFSSMRASGTDVIYASLDMAEMLRFRTAFPVLDRMDDFSIKL